MAYAKAADAIERDAAALAADDARFDSHRFEAERDGAREFAEELDKEEREAALDQALGDLQADADVIGDERLGELVTRYARAVTGR